MLDLRGETYTMNADCTFGLYSLRRRLRPSTVGMGGNCIDPASITPAVAASDYS